MDHLEKLMIIRFRRQQTTILADKSVAPQPAATTFAIPSLTRKMVHLTHIQSTKSKLRTDVMLLYSAL